MAKGVVLFMKAIVNGKIILKDKIEENIDENDIELVYFNAGIETYLKLPFHHVVHFALNEVFEALVIEFQCN